LFSFGAFPSPTVCSLYLLENFLFDSRYK